MIEYKQVSIEIIRLIALVVDLICLNIRKALTKL